MRQRKFCSRIPRPPAGADAEFDEGLHCRCELAAMPRRASPGRLPSMLEAETATVERTGGESSWQAHGRAAALRFDGLVFHAVLMCFRIGPASELDQSMNLLIARNN